MQKFDNSSMIPKEYKQIIDATAIVSKTDDKGIITYVNDMFCKTSGYAREELIGKSHRLVRHPETPKSSFAEMWNTIKTKKEPWYGIIRNRRKDGTDYVVEARIRPQLNEDNEIIGYIGIRYDITELEHQKELNKTIMDSQDQVVIVGDKENGIVSVNQAFYSVFGFKSLDYFKRQNTCIISFINNANEIPTDKMNDIIEKNDCELYRIKISTAMQGERVFQLKIKNFKNGIRHYYIITLNDVTYLQHKIDDAKKEVYAKSNFLATMSHEIRTPLNGVLPFLELLQDTSLTAEQQDYVDTISKSSNHLLGIINDILDFSKIESGNLKIEEIEFNPVDEFETLAELYIAKANEKKVDLCVFVDPNMPKVVKGDPLRIKQILSNFITNAIKFTDAEGEVFVAIEYWGQMNSHSIINFSVKDTGVGIDNDKLNAIFDPFSQADNSISRKFGGTGLGLSISQNLAKLMGTEIKIKSTIGEGSEFSFQLLLKTDELAFRNKRFSNEYKDFKAAIYIAQPYYERCSKILERYFEAFGFEYSYVENKREFEISNSDILFIVSSGNDQISWLQSHKPLGYNHKIIAVLPSRAENGNKFYCDSSIYMPINGSKIFDVIIETHKFENKISDINVNTPKNIDHSKLYKNKKVLIVEDNSTNQKLAIAMLKKFDITPDIANNGLEAVEMVKNNRTQYDLILMDIHMPLMNGVDATIAIINYFKENDLNQTPIVALTADALKEHTQSFLDVGMADFISKPIAKQQFDEIIERYLSSDIKTIEAETFNSISDLKQSQTSKQRIMSIIMRDLDLDEETALFLYDDYISNWNMYKPLLQDAINDLNYEQIRSISHAIKGSSGSMRIINAYDLAKEIEDNAKVSNKEFAFSEIFNKLVCSIED